VVRADEDNQLAFAGDIEGFRQAVTLESEGHNSIAGHLPQIISTLIDTGQPAQN
jgi:hypothetical protein